MAKPLIKITGNIVLTKPYTFLLLMASRTNFAMLHRKTFNNGQTIIEADPRESTSGREHEIARLLVLLHRRRRLRQHLLNHRRRRRSCGALRRLTRNRSHRRLRHWRSVLCLPRVPLVRIGHHGRLRQSFLVLPVRRHFGRSQERRRRFRRGKARLVVGPEHRRTTFGGVRNLRQRVRRRRASRRDGEEVGAERFLLLHRNRTWRFRWLRWIRIRCWRILGSGSHEVGSRRRWNVGRRTGRFF